MIVIIFYNEQTSWITDFTENIERGECEGMKIYIVISDSIEALLERKLLRSTEYDARLCAV